MMFRKYASIGLIASALGMWMSVPGVAEAQKGGSKGGGGGRSAPRSAPAVRSAPAPSIRSAPAPSIRSAPAPTIRSTPGGNQAKSIAPANKSITPSAKSVAPAGTIVRTPPVNNKGPGASTTVRSNSFNRGYDSFNRGYDPRWNGSGRYYNDYNYRYGQYYGRYRYHNDDFWRFALYASIADWVGFRPFGYSSYGLWGYSPYYYPYPGVIYDTDVVQAQALVQDGSADIEVILPDPDAQVWIDGSETASRGTNRRYESPVLEAGWNYSYSVRASWTTEDGETRTVERQVPLSAGGRVTVDFTTTPSRVMVR